MRRNRVVRRSQLIAPFGPGGMIVTPDGTSLIAAGLDHWFEPETVNKTKVDAEEFHFREWRLERELDVDYFCLPPDYRVPWQFWGSAETVNSGLTIPFLRFPQWHVCPRCQTLQPWPLVLREIPRCHACDEGRTRRSGRRPPPMVQVRFIAMCDRGHLQDFPWREWVHADPDPSCNLRLKLLAFGTTSLSGMRVTCDCGQSRTLEGITEGDPLEAFLATPATEPEHKPSTYLSRNLVHGLEYLCKGLRPWLADETGEGCGRPLWGSLRGATNVYFAHVRSAIYLPRGAPHAPPALVERLEAPPLWGLICYSRDLGQRVEPTVLRKHYANLLEQFSDKEVEVALEILFEGQDPAKHFSIPEDDPETAFRRVEFAALGSEREDDELLTNPVPLSSYSPEFARSFAKITLVKKVRESRALWGFSRVFPENSSGLEERKALLRRVPPESPNRWLPAYIVHGEGIFLELAHKRLSEWEKRNDVRTRSERLANHYRVLQERRGLRPRAITSRFLLCHTLAHLLMNQLTFECGYSTASLRERLYHSATPEAPMAGLLIYTAAGDAEGTLGGLVRMGSPGILERVLRRAVQRAQWCSSDPVCMEIGASGGQGPDSCNLAACHNCALVPETSCEEFNRFLDRGLVVGTVDNPDLGFFARLNGN